MAYVLPGSIKHFFFSAFAEYPQNSAAAELSSHGKRFHKMCALCLCAQPHVPGVRAWATAQNTTVHSLCACCISPQPCWVSSLPLPASPGVCMGWIDLKAHPQFVSSKDNPQLSVDSGLQGLHSSMSMTTAGQHKLSELQDKLCETQSFRWPGPHGTFKGFWESFVFVCRLRKSLRGEGSAS